MRSSLGNRDSPSLCGHQLSVGFFVFVLVFWFFFSWGWGSLIFPPSTLARLLSLSRLGSCLGSHITVILWVYLPWTLRRQPHSGLPGPLVFTVFLSPALLWCCLSLRYNSCSLGLGSSDQLFSVFWPIVSVWSEDLEPQTRENIQCLPLWFQLHSFTCKLHNFTRLCSWLVSHCVCVPRFHCLLVSWRTLRLFPCPSPCKQSGSKHGLATICRIECWVWASGRDS